MFRFGYVDENVNKEQPAESVKVKSILLEKSWQPQIGKYKLATKLYDDGKDIAILILEKDVTTVIDSIAYPQVIPFNQPNPCRRSIEVYGYPTSICTLATGQCKFEPLMNQEWAHCTHKATTVEGISEFLFSFCVSYVIIYHFIFMNVGVSYLCVLNLQKRF